MEHYTNSTNLADLLERILDKGVVIAGDITVKIVSVELLTIQLRLLICSVDKAKELGVDWWDRSKLPSEESRRLEATLATLEERLKRMETHHEPASPPSQSNPET